MIESCELQRNKDDELGQLQEMLAKMLEEDWFSSSTDNFEAYNDEISSQHSEDKPDQEPNESINDSVNDR